MINDYQLLVPKILSKNTRVWIYQSNRKFNSNEELAISNSLKSFNENWLSHGSKVQSHCFLLYSFFLVFMADETEMTVSGCSIDSTVRFVKSLESAYNVSFFDRTTLAFLIDSEVKLMPLSLLNSAFKAGKISLDSLFFDNTVQNLPAFLDKWIVPVSDSWLGKRLNVNIPE
jgi:hypothetical protein